MSARKRAPKRDVAGILLSNPSTPIAAAVGAVGLTGLVGLGIASGPFKEGVTDLYHKGRDVVAEGYERSRAKWAAAAAALEADREKRRREEAKLEHERQLQLAEAGRPEAPIYQAPVYEAPIFQAPVYEAPSTTPAAGSGASPPHTPAPTLNEESIEDIARVVLAHGEGRGYTGRPGFTVTDYQVAFSQRSMGRSLNDILFPQPSRSVPGSGSGSGSGSQTSGSGSGPGAGGSAESTDWVATVRGLWEKGEFRLVQTPSGTRIPWPTNKEAAYWMGLKTPDRIIWAAGNLGLVVDESLSGTIDVIMSAESHAAGLIESITGHRVLTQEQLNEIDRISTAYITAGPRLLREAAAEKPHAGESKWSAFWRKVYAGVGLIPEEYGR